MEGIKTHFDLFFIIFFSGKLRNFILGKIGKANRFDIRLKTSANHRTQHKDFTDPVSIYRQIMLFSVLDSNNAFDNNIKSGFFFYFLDSVFGNGYIDITPAAGQRPGSIFFLDEKYFIVLEYSGAGINFRGLIPNFVTKKPVHFFERYVSNM